MSRKNLKKKKPSLADIAKSLGVSRTLVSMVLNDRGDENGINQDTQKKVLAKAKELKYKPNLLARGLRLGRTDTIGLIVTDISNVFYSRIARSIEDYASKNGYRLMICSSDEDPDKEIGLIQMFKERQADGLIIATSLKSSEEIQNLLDDNLPFVLVDRILQDIDSHSVSVNNFEGAKKAVDRLFEMGWHKIGMLAITPTFISSIQERIRGYKTGIETNGLTFDASLIREIPFNEVKKSVYKELDDLTSGPDPVSAIFVANNNLAIATLEYANDHGLNIPVDLAIISFDDNELFKFCQPPITVVSQPIEEIGRKAMEILLTEIKGKEQDSNKEKVLLDTKLIVRDSCGKGD